MILNTLFISMKNIIKISLATMTGVLWELLGISLTLADVISFPDLTPDGEA